MRFAALVLVLVIASLGTIVWEHLRSSRTSVKGAEPQVTDATTWQVHLNGIAVATISEQAVAEIERRLNREWWLGMRTAVAEFGTFVRLAAVSLIAGFAIEMAFIVLGIQGDPRGAGHTLHAVLTASEATLQSGWSLLWQLGALSAILCFVVALWAGMRRRARDFVSEAWWTCVRRAARVPADGNLSVMLTQEGLQLWRCPHQVGVDRSGRTDLA